MNLRNAKHIFLREVRDQLRDRRTLFIIAILPILLYPLLGMSMFQMAQFMQEQPTKILVVGGRQMLQEKNDKGVVPLFIVAKELEPTDGDIKLKPDTYQKLFSPDLFPDKEEKDRLKQSKLRDLTFWEDWANAPKDKDVDQVEYAREMVHSGKFDAAVCFAPDFAAQLERFRDAYQKQGKPEAKKGKIKVPQPSIIYTTTNERSRITYERVKWVIESLWVPAVGRKNLKDAGLPTNVTEPFRVLSDDLAVREGKSGIAIWAKLLPLMLVLWALTGAFYPAIDLCAGEKERGTLETLLCSPAQRSEIVLGKLGTVMVFSIMTAILNLASIGVTGWLMISKIPMIGAKVGSPPWLAIIWLLPILIPVAALFSAVCVALAAFAKSSKEGQYYLVPVLLIVLPLAVLPMAPSVELNLGTSLIPITNICLILRVLIEGQYLIALKFAAPVIIVTAFCCLFAIRWAVDQFQHEGVLFRESERLDLALWVRHLFKDRHPTPTVAAAALAGTLILVLRFFVGAMMQDPTCFDDTIRMILIIQIGVILAPALLMTMVFTTARAKTLLLGRDAWRSKKLPTMLLMAFGLAVFGHPLVIAFQYFVLELYPMPDIPAFEKMFEGATSLGTILLFFAVLPAICEEIAFRGFILSGFRHTGSKWRAIAMTAILFGVTHGILQQSIITAVIGLVVGYLAVQSGNLLVPIVYHVTHNTLGMCFNRLQEEAANNFTVLGGAAAWENPIAKGFVIVLNEFVYYFVHWDGGKCYDWRLVTVAGLIFASILISFSFFRYETTDEERLRKEIARNQRLQD
ncbi:MAG: ABC transporter permease subunit/CPBP intramembrane protease [Planctomycetia bacterium]|jgi:sodium transport system permease protein